MKLIYQPIKFHCLLDPARQIAQIYIGQKGFLGKMVQFVLSKCNICNWTVLVWNHTRDLVPGKLVPFWKEAKWYSTFINSLDKTKINSFDKTKMISAQLALIRHITIANKLRRTWRHRNYVHVTRWRCINEIRPSEHISLCILTRGLQLLYFIAWQHKVP